MVTAGELFRVARVLREVALASTADPGEPPPAAGLVSVTDDVAHHDGTTVGEIASRTGLAQSLVSKMVAQLRDGGVVSTVVDDQDRRRTRIRLTDLARGQVFADRGGRGVTDALRQRLPELDDAQLAGIEAALEQLAGHLRS